MLPSDLLEPTHSLSKGGSIHIHILVSDTNTFGIGIGLGRGIVRVSVKVNHIIPLLYPSICSITPWNKIPGRALVFARLYFYSYSPSCSD